MNFDNEVIFIRLILNWNFIMYFLNRFNKHKSMKKINEKKIIFTLIS